MIVPSAINLLVFFWESPIFIEFLWLKNIEFVFNRHFLATLALTHLQQQIYTTFPCKIIFHYLHHHIRCWGNFSPTRHCLQIDRFFFGIVLIFPGYWKVAPTNSIGKCRGVFFSPRQCLLFHVGVLVVCSLLSG